ncbi:DUF952 domain-containing protein [Demequina aurantiaca]|uniref:DUF952 domain-containing protein n=1 Tax=Demequina aurantiaca TaxID=676200 RepID=UPI0007867CCC|nr:DUF952 domain-containing protein [Demequina aurantiaca]
MNLENREYYYHLALAEYWPPAPGEPYERSSIDSTLQQEGYIHLSRASQVRHVADKFYKGRDDVILLTIDSELLDSRVEFEKSPDHELPFPHLFGPIMQRAVIHTDRVQLDEDGLLLLDQLLPV